MGKGPLQMQSVPQPKLEEQPAPGSKFPMHVHRTNDEGDREAKDVVDEADLKTALKDGWVADVRDLEPKKKGKK